MFARVSAAVLSAAPAVRVRLLSAAAAAKVLVVVEHNNRAMGSGTLNAISAAKKVGAVSALVVGSSCDGVAEEVAKVQGVDSVFVVDDAKLERPLAEAVSPVVASMQKSHSFTHILAPATAFGKNIIPRVGAMLDVQPITDVIAVNDASTFVRPIYAGNAIATVQSSDAVKVMTIRTTSFEKAAATGGSAAVTKVDGAPAANEQSAWVGESVSKSERPELTSARFVVSGGRGMKSSENFALLDKLAEALGDCAVGASRAAVDLGIAPNDMQVGQTGKIVAPELYVAVAISGAIQHLAGMKDSKVIVAINKDPEAPIFQVADYGLVADLFDAVPKMTELLNKK